MGSHRVEYETFSPSVSFLGHAGEAPITVPVAAIESAAEPLMASQVEIAVPWSMELDRHIRTRARIFGDVSIPRLGTVRVMLWWIRDRFDGPVRLSVLRYWVDAETLRALRATGLVAPELPESELRRAIADAESSLRAVRDRDVREELLRAFRTLADQIYVIDARTTAAAAGLDAVRTRLQELAKGAAPESVTEELSRIEAVMLEHAS